MDTDDERSVPLELLDPEAHDPGYWHCFRREVLRQAAGELARRRRRVAVTVSDVVSSWGRAVVPAALATALLAGVLLFQESPEAPAPDRLTDVEEMLAGDLGDDPIPVVLASEGELSVAGGEF